MRNLCSDCIISIPMYIHISIIKKAPCYHGGVNVLFCTVLGNLSHWIQQALPNKSDLGFVLVDYGHVRYKVKWLLLGMFNYCNSYQYSIPIPLNSSPLPIFIACINNDITTEANNEQWFVYRILFTIFWLRPTHQNCHYLFSSSVLWIIYLFVCVNSAICGINFESKLPCRMLVEVKS